MGITPACMGKKGHKSNICLHGQILASINWSIDDIMCNIYQNYIKDDDKNQTLYKLLQSGEEKIYVSFTGHSLGGAYATVVALLSNYYKEYDRTKTWCDDPKAKNGV